MIYHFQHNNKNNILPLQLHMLGIDHLQEPINRPHGISLYQWFFCINGKGEFIVNGQRSIISKGQGLLIYADLPHIYSGLTDDFTLDFIGFTGPFCSELLRSLHMTTSGVYHFSNPDIFYQYARKITELAPKEKKDMSKEYSALCYRFLLELSEIISWVTPSEQISKNDTIRQLIFYMEENYMNDISLSDLAEEVNLSKEYICTIFKQEMDQSLMHYLRGLRMIHAKILLHQYPEKKTLEIARMCGFQSPSYFGKLFKEETGVTPEYYRKNT